MSNVIGDSLTNAFLLGNRMEFVVNCASAAAPLTIFTSKQGSIL
jgi:hypothetical protein